MDDVLDSRSNLATNNPSPSFATLANGKRYPSTCLGGRDSPERSIADSVQNPDDVLPLTLARVSATGPGGSLGSSRSVLEPFDSAVNTTSPISRVDPNKPSLDIDPGMSSRQLPVSSHEEPASVPAIYTSANIYPILNDGLGLAAPENMGSDDLDSTPDAILQAVEALEPKTKTRADAESGMHNHALREPLDSSPKQVGLSFVILFYSNSSDSQSLTSNVPTEKTGNHLLNGSVNGSVNGSMIALPVPSSAAHEQVLRTKQSQPSVSTEPYSYLHQSQAGPSAPMNESIPAPSIEIVTDTVFSNKGKSTTRRAKGFKNAPPSGRIRMV